MLSEDEFPTVITKEFKKSGADQGKKRSEKGITP